MGSTAGIRQVILKSKAVLCALLVLNLHAWIAGCTGPAGIMAPLTGILRIELSPDHALTKALNNSVLIGAEALEIDPARKSFRVIFAAENREVTGTYAVANGVFTITQFTFGRFGRSVTMSLDLSKRVQTITTDDGFVWRRPASWSLIEPSSNGVEGYVQANAQLLDITRGAEQGQTLNPGNGTTNPGTGGEFDAALSALVSNKADSADAGLLLLVLGTMLAVWGPVLGMLTALLSIFLVIATIQSLVGDLDGSAPGPAPLPGGDPPPVNPVPPVPPPPVPPPPVGETPVDCNDNGVSDITDIADGTVQDSNGNGVPDICESLPPPPGNAISLSVTASRDWTYEHLVFQATAVNNCEVSFTAVVGADPLGNSSFTYQWTISPPADRPGAVFTPVSGGTTATPTFLPPARPASSLDDYIVTVVATGNRGNMGSATTTIKVRLLGDFDNSGCVNQADIDFVNQVEAGILTGPENVLRADVNCDGTTNYVLDASVVDFVRLNLDGRGSGVCN